MLSAMELEKLIIEKKSEIEKEKAAMGITSTASCENDTPQKKVNFCATRPSQDNNASKSEEKKESNGSAREDFEEDIPPDLERYIRRYIGLPVMLKAGEYSPNNPLVRCERRPGDVMLALGEYERHRNTLRRMRQQQYREYLDEQAKKKQEAKDQAERERREREAKEREHEEREREREEREREQRERDRRLAQQERRSPEARRTSVSYANTHCSNNRVDTGVQVDSVSTPLSVAVQTENADMLQLPSPKFKLTEAERELSPHTVVDPSDRPIQPATWTVDTWNARTHRRRSYGDFDERSRISTKKSNREKLVSDLRHSYMPSIFDADAIQLRNVQAEKEAAARRQFYQQELKNQIMEQQRIREERKAREKMLEHAEMRRLEEQLRMLRVAQEQEVDKQQRLDETIRKDTGDYQSKRTALQKEIDAEQQKLRAPVLTHLPTKRTETSRSDDAKPVLYPRIQERYILQDRKPTSLDRFPINQAKKPTQERFPSSIPDNSIFSPNYDVDSYLRKNLNFRDRYDFDVESIGREKKSERVLVHERPKKVEESTDTLPIPVLRHTSVSQGDRVENELSDAMNRVDDKWKVPIVQKNILKSVPNDEGKKVSILTQLGSIRRQLQLEQLKLDQMSV